MSAKLREFDIVSSGVHVRVREDKFLDGIG